MYERLKAGVEWSWDSSCDEAFNQCKRLLSREDGNKLLSLATDASSYGDGAVIRHQMVDEVEKPIAFASRTLRAAERNYSQINRCEEIPPIPHGAIIHQLLMHGVSKQHCSGDTGYNRSSWTGRV